MNKIDTKNLNIEKLTSGIRDGSISCFEVVSQYIENIKNKNVEINAYLEVFEDALIKAKNIDEGNVDKNLPLIGVPIAVKDNILIEGKECNASSKALVGYKAPYSATIIKKLEDAGAIFIGRTNMDEFAMGGSTENSAFGVTKNPLDTTRVAGGSSGGSAAALAMDGCLVALGSDTGGSIREPASFCSLVGLKPTYGAVSRYGLIAMGSSLDQIGTFSKNITDAKIVFDIIKGQDIKDATSLNKNTYKEIRGSREERIKDKRKLKIGIPFKFLKEYENGIEKSVLDSFNKSVESLKTKGYEVVEIDLPNIKYSLAVYYIVMPAEVSSNMARFDGLRFGQKVEGENLLQDYMKTRGELLGIEVKRRIILGTYVLSSGYHDAYYNKALALRNIIKEDFAKAFEKVDLILTPTAPVRAFKIGEKAHDPLAMYLADIFTVTANLTGHPAISVPDNLQFTASFTREEDLFEIGKDILNN